MLAEQFCIIIVFELSLKILSANSYIHTALPTTLISWVSSLMFLIPVKLI